VVAIADDITRFATAHEFEAYLGLVPAERSSGEHRRVGHITKAGNGRARALLVEVAWSIMRSRRRETDALRTWATKIALRRGKRIAVVALARRMAGILYAMWRDERTYEPARLRMPSPRA
jgi:transposase